ncbi:hypothetical protein [Enterococcus cecorum]|uniref:hypothetical protein n=1 Tax=Enterococcus cecorum TaxID=44008 RepID=UPI0032647CAB
MNKKYVVEEQSGCGCGTFIGICIIIYLLVKYGVYIATFSIIALIIAIIIFWTKRYPKIKAEQNAANEEANLAERERRIENEIRRRKIEAKEKELFDDEDDLDF